VSKFASCFVALLIALGVSSAELRAEDVLRIGVEGAYKPFSWKESDGTLKGFDIDMAMALCEKMGRACTLVEQDWDGMIPALLAKKYDAIIASMSITDERKKRVDFSIKYYRTPTKFVAKKGSGLVATPDGLKGKRVGLQRGTIQQCYMEKVFKDTELILYATQEEVYQDLAAGRIDAQISDAVQALGSFLRTATGAEYGFIGDEQFDLECMGEGSGIAVRKGEDDLRAAFNAAIKAIRQDGTYAKINSTYFEFDIYGADIK